MASEDSAARKSLAVLPSGFVILAKRISEGGELLVGRHPLQRSTDIRTDCLAHGKKGRVCDLGPLADIVKIRGIKSKLNTANYGKTSTGGRPKGRTVYKPKTARQRASVVYHQYQLDIKGLEHPTAYKPPVIKETMPAHKPVLTEEEKELAEMSIFRDTSFFERSEALNAIFQEKTIEEVKSRDLQDMFSNILQIPLHKISRFSVLVKWKQHPSIPCYTTRSIFNALSKYGVIVAMGQLSVNSCLVLFENFHVAMLVVRDALIGPRAYPLICKWYYPHMYLHSIDLLDIHPYKKQEKVSEEAKWLHQFREMQNQVINCFKTRGVNLSYDRSTFHS